MNEYRKAIAALLTSTLAWATAVVQSPAGPISAAEWLVLAGAGVTTATVFLVPNEPADDGGAVSLSELALVVIAVSAFLILAKYRGWF